MAGLGADQSIINDNSRPAYKLQDNSQNTCGQEHINNFAWPIKLNICKVLAPASVE